MSGWSFGAVLSGLALPGVALAGAVPASAPTLSTNDPYAAGAPPPPTAVSPAPPPAPAPPAPGGSAPPLPSPPPPYAPPPPGYYGYPPPGYYGYPPPAYLSPDAFAAQRIAVLDAQIRDLQRRYDEIGLTLPVVLLVSGGAIGLLGVGVYAGSICTTDQYGNREDPTCVENSAGRERGLELLAVGALGLAFGGTSLVIRTAKRRHIDRQIDARQIAVNALRAYAAPRLGVSPLRSGGGVFSLALDF